jgi:hypothetical protein
MSATATVIDAIVAIRIRRWGERDIDASGI